MKKLGDRFILEREIGAGGMSVVYLGRDEVLDRPVAVKVLKPGFEGSDVGARFSREGRTAARISHPNVVQVYDAGQADLDGREVSYIVMEYLSNGDLMDLINRDGTLPGDRLAFLAEAAAGLAHAHQNGIVHRDIKPHNILIDDYGRPKLSDFGIAKALDAAQATQTGFYLGTALYSSPEQLQGHGAGTKSDIYSFGATLYYAVVGEPLFQGSAIEVASQHVTQPPTPPTERGAEIDAATEATIMACLAKDPADRPTAEEVEAALKKAASPARTTETRAQPMPPPASPTPAQERTAVSETPARTTTVRRRSWAPVIAVVALLALLGVAGAAALPAFLGDGAAEQQVSGGGSEGGSGGSSGGEAQNSNAGQRGSASSGEQAQAEPSAGDSSGGSSSSDGGGSEEANGASEAEAVVQEFYSSAVSGDYERSSELLSEGFRQSTFPDESVFQNTFSTLESIEFVEGPTAQVSGETATVDGVTIARHTDRTERNTGKWRLVKEGGEWKLDSVNVQTTQL